jgi:hypothetical protein
LIRSKPNPFLSSRLSLSALTTSDSLLDVTPSSTSPSKHGMISNHLVNNHLISSLRQHMTRTHTTTSTRTTPTQIIEACLTYQHSTANRQQIHGRREISSREQHPHPGRAPCDSVAGSVVVHEDRRGEFCCHAAPGTSRRCYQCSFVCSSFLFYCSRLTVGHPV